MPRINKINGPTSEIRIVPNSSSFKITNLENSEIFQKAMEGFLISEELSYVISEGMIFSVPKLSPERIEELEKKFFNFSLGHFPSWVTIKITA